MVTGARWPIIVVFALSFVWGSDWIANQLVSEQGEPCALASLRYLLGAFVLGGFLLVRRGQRAPGTRTAIAGLRSNLLLGVTMFAAPYLLLWWTAMHGAAAFTPLVYAAMPLGLLLAAGELRGVAIVAMGAMLVLLNGSLPLTAGKLVWTLPLVLAVALQGWSLLYARRHYAAAASLAGITVQLSSAGLLLGMASLLLERVPRLQPLQSWAVSALLALAALAIVGTAAAYPVYYRLLETLAPAQLASTAWLQTLVAVGESAWLLRQRPGWTMVGAAAVLLGCAYNLLRGVPDDSLSLRPDAT